jgi:hypothetical protein
MFGSKKKGLIRSHIESRKKDDRLTLLIDSSFSEEERSSSCLSCQNEDKDEDKDEIRI